MHWTLAALCSVNGTIKQRCVSGSAREMRDGWGLCSAVGERNEVQCTKTDGKERTPPMILKFDSWYKEVYLKFSFFFSIRNSLINEIKFLLARIAESISWNAENLKIRRIILIFNCLVGIQFSILHRKIN